MTHRHHDENNGSTDMQLLDCNFMPNCTMDGCLDDISPSPSAVFQIIWLSKNDNFFWHDHVLIICEFVEVRNMPHVCCRVSAAKQAMQVHMSSCPEDAQ